MFEVSDCSLISFFPFCFIEQNIYCDFKTVFCKIQTKQNDHVNYHVVNGVRAEYISVFCYDSNLSNNLNTIRELRVFEWYFCTREMNSHESACRPKIIFLHISIFFLLLVRNRCYNIPLITYLLIVNYLNVMGPCNTIQNFLDI